ncbi:hypothetical protein P7C70_g6589, partial [Phenoliferia sp. Uapishka_3]
MATSITRPRKSKIKVYTQGNDRPAVLTPFQAAALSREQAPLRPAFRLSPSESPDDDYGGGGDDGGWQDLEAAQEVAAQGVFLRHGIRRPRDRRTAASRRLAKREGWRVAIPGLMGPYLDFKKALSEKGDLWDRGLEEEEASGVLLISIGGRYKARPLEYSHVGPSYMRCGYLGGTPSLARVAFDVRMLEFFLVLQTIAFVNPYSFIQALAQHHNVAFVRSHYTLFQDAVSAFRSIRRKIDNSVNVEIKRNGDPILSSCPPCQFEVSYYFNWDAPSLTGAFSESQTAGDVLLNPAAQLAMDGNNSQKRYATRGFETVNHPFLSPLLLTPAEVNRCDYNSTRAPEKHDTCNANFVVSNQPAALKSLVGIHISGIFTGGCRHAILFTCMDMIKSGELAKYPIATARRIRAAFPPTTNLDVGYDIGCGFRKTFARADAQEAEELDLLWGINGENAMEVDEEVNHDATGVRRKTKGCIEFPPGAFHVCGHSQHCQVNNSPRRRKGRGLEDYEIMERVFSAMNKIATSTQHSGEYRRSERIEAQIVAWNLQKLLGLGNWCKNRARLANRTLQEQQNIIKSYAGTEEIDTSAVESRADVWSRDELAFFNNVAPIPPAAKLAEERAIAEEIYARAIILEAKLVAEKAALQASITTTHVNTWNAKKRALAAASADSVFLQEKLQIVVPWVAGGASVAAALLKGEETELEVCGRKLEGSLIARLLELEKAGLSGTGYNARQHITKAVAKRSGAVHNLLSDYNTKAIKLGRPDLTWELFGFQAVDYAYDGGFGALKASWDGVEWAQPRQRAVLRAVQLVARSKEELIRLQVEIKRTTSWCAHERNFWIRTVRATEEWEDLGVTQGPLNQSQLAFAVQMQGLASLMHLGIIEDDLPAAAEAAGVVDAETAVRGEFVRGWPGAGQVEVDEGQAEGENDGNTDEEMTEQERADRLGALGEVASDDGEGSDFGGAPEEVELGLIAEIMVNMAMSN